MSDVTILSVGTTVLVVGAHPGFRSMTRRMLHAAGLRVVGEAVDGRGALAAALSLRPHVALINVDLPDMDGIEVAGRLATWTHPPAVLLVSSREADDYGTRVRICGARAFIPNSRLSADTILTALREGP